MSIADAYDPPDNAWGDCSRQQSVPSLSGPTGNFAAISIRQVVDKQRRQRLTEPR